MKRLILLFGCLYGQILFAQPNTEVFLFDLDISGDSIVLSNKTNISNNEGYDNQPSFYDENTVLFSSTRNGQTDIRSYDITSGETKWVTDTPGGSEYSPTRIVADDAISAIRLDTTGLQRLYRYDIRSGKSERILEEAKVGYYMWYSKDVVVNTVLVENRMDLVISHLNGNNDYTFQKKVGRNLLRIPGSERISYVSKEGDQNVLKSMDVLSGANDSIINAFAIEDFAWLGNGTLLAGYENKLLKYQRKKDDTWKPAHKFMDSEIGTITRIVVSPDQTKLVLVASASPEAIINKQVKTFNDRDLDGFVSCYSENVLVNAFPSDTMYVGRKTMRRNYGQFFENTASSKVEVLKRIVLGTTVIDEEMATDDDQTTHQVAIYQVNNGAISSMTFIFENGGESPLEIVQEQLEAYNNRDIDAFLRTYSEDISLYNYPNKKTSQGQEQMRQGYQGFFESTPDLHCEIKNRIVIGNKVIDEEFLTINGRNFSAVAIYEVVKGKIAKVTFIQ